MRVPRREHVVIAFVYDNDSTTGHCAIKLGTGDSSAKTKGNVFERFRIEGNRIYRSPTAKLNESFTGFIWYNCWAGEDRLNQTVIRGNRLYPNGPTKPLVMIPRDNQSVGLVVDDNTVHPYTPTPRTKAR